MTESLDFQGILDDLSDPYVVLDTDYCLVWANKSYVKMGMIELEKVKGKYFFDVFPANPHDYTATGVRDHFLDSLDKVVRTKVYDAIVVQKYDIRRPESEGGQYEVHYWSTISAPFLGNDQKVKYIVIRVEDVTEFMQLKEADLQQKKITEELRVHAEQMEAEIFQRTMEIQKTNKKLLIINDELATSKLELEDLYKRLAAKNIALEEVNKELEAFSYSVAHDLRNPLNVVNGFSYLLQKSERLNEIDKDYIKHILNASQNMEELIKNLLSFSHAFRCKLNCEEFDLSVLIKDLLNSLQEVSPERKSEFIIQDNVLIKGDKQFLRIVFENLLINAWKYTSTKPVTIIEFGIIINENQSQGSIYFIRDNGIGFPQEDAYKLFHPFIRLHSAADFPGTGIGLATVKRIMERHGGRIWAESSIDKGSTFYLSMDNPSLIQ